MTRFDKFIHGALVFAFLLVCAGFSSATSAATGPATASTTLPTTYTDGSSLAAADITSTEYDCTFTPPAGTASPCTFSPTTVAGNGNSLTTTITYPAATGGKACFRVRAKTASATSAWSTVDTVKSCKDFPALNPSAPGSVTLTITVAINLTSNAPIRVAVNPPVVTQEPQP